MQYWNGPLVQLRIQALNFKQIVAFTATQGPNSIRINQKLAVIYTVRLHPTKQGNRPIFGKSCRDIYKEAI